MPITWENNSSDGRKRPQVRKNKKLCYVNRIAVDPIFPPPNYQNTKKFNVYPDNIMESNKFELIYDERLVAKKLKDILHSHKGFFLNLLHTYFLSSDTAC